MPGKARKLTRRVGAENSATRALILDTTEKLMVDEGYAAVTTRRVAAEAGLKAPLIHYYFPTTDDLFVAVYRRAAEQVFLRLDTALTTEQPLRALWEFVSDPSRTTLAVELMALANHRKIIRHELAAYTERTRRRQAEVLEALLKESAIGSAPCPPIALTVLIVGVARALVMESSVGISLGHEETRACVERWLGLLEATPGKRARRSKK
jgi:AcrR family transcriptional regulator